MSHQDHRTGCHGFVDPQKTERPVRSLARSATVDQMENRIP